MESNSSRGWLVILLLVLLGIGVAFFAFRAYQKAKVEETQAQVMRAYAEQAEAQVHAQQEEIDRLRAELERIRRERVLR